MNARARARCLIAAGLALAWVGCESRPPPFEMQPLERPAGLDPAEARASEPAAPDPIGPPPAEAPPPEDGPRPTGEEPTPEGAVRLAWKVPADGALAFRAGLERVPADGPSVPIAALASKGELPPEAARRLAGPRPAGPTPGVMVLQPNPGGTFTGRMFGKDARAVRDPNVARLMQAETRVLWKGALDESGRALAYDLSVVQRLALGLFFELPARPVRPGDTWSVDVDLLGRDEGFRPDKTQRWNQVTLRSLAPEKGAGQVAVLEYRLAQHEEGTQLDDEDRARPATRGAAFLGRAEFLVDRGTWRVFAGRLTTRMTGPAPLEEHRALALVPLTELPREISLDRP